MSFLRLKTRHDEAFDILSTSIDPQLSKYVAAIPDYAAKLNAFYSRLGVKNVVWTFPASVIPTTMEVRKPVEYELCVRTDRVIAYVEEHSWNDYLHGKRPDFEFSQAPAQYQDMSILINAPIFASEIIATRRFHMLGSPQHFEIVDERWHNLTQ
jgi:hypothetical protein